MKQHETNEKDVDFESLLNPFHKTDARETSPRIWSEWRKTIERKAFFAGLYTGITLAACLFLGCLWFKDALCR